MMCGLQFDTLCLYICLGLETVCGSPSRGIIFTLYISGCVHGSFNWHYEGAFSLLQVGRTHLKWSFWNDINDDKGTPLIDGNQRLESEQRPFDCQSIELLASCHVNGASQYTRYAFDAAGWCGVESNSFGLERAA